MSKIYSKNKDAKELEVPFTMVPNFALDTIEMRSPAENCLYFVIIRQTVGYLNQNGSRKSKADLSISRLVKLTGLSRQGVLNSRRNLYDAGWILYRINSSMTSYGIIDRYEEFRKKLESTELTEPSQLSRQDESTELTEPSQLSRHIKEISKINTLKEKEKEEIPFPSQSKFDEFKNYHERKLGYKDDAYQVDVLATKLDYSTELYDKVLEAKNNSDWLPRRNQPNNAKYLVKAFENETLGDKQEFAYINKSSGGFE